MGGYADQVSVLKASMQIAGAIRDALARNGHSRETFPTWILRQYADEALSDAGFPGAP